ncbi:MAG TPA: hypothetical protein VEN12_00320 [Verrucomicrobiae bacterium]|nr:hypothetical protein [Verrucomicrobiae bacterium]
MSTFKDDIERGPWGQVKAGRQTIERTLGEIPEMDVRQMPPAAFVVGALMVSAMAVGVGWMLYRSRKRRPIVERLQGAIPGGVKDLPGEIRDQIRRAL